MNKDKLTPYSLWKHVKTNSLYIVLGIGLCSSNGEREHTEESVIYYSLAHKGLRYRLLSEFLDGRFIPYEETKIDNGTVDEEMERCIKVVESKEPWIDKKLTQTIVNDIRQR